MFFNFSTSCMHKNFVLVFHKENNGQLFEKIIIALKARYRLVSIAELEELFVQKKRFSNICHISFDDGDESFYRVVYPVLKKHNVPVSLFVSPDIISSGANYWFQEMEGVDESIMKDILADQLNISPHAIEKYPVSSVLKCLPYNKIKNAIEIYQQNNDCKRKPSQNMSTEQLKEVAASGLVAVGAHTINHPVLKNEVILIYDPEIMTLYMSLSRSYLVYISVLPCCFSCCTTPTL